MKKAILLFGLLCVLFSACSSDDEPEQKRYFEVFVEEYCIGDCMNTSEECTKWKADNEIYLTGNGTVSGYGVQGFTKHWTRHFYDTESKVKQWCEKPLKFTIYHSEKRMDEFKSRYYVEKVQGVKYEPVPMD